MLEIKNLIVSIEDKIILNRLNVKINPGEIHVIMGPNGVGKSTLTKVIMGDPNYKIISGDIIYKGESILGLKTDERAKKGIFLANQNPPQIDGVSNSDFLRTALSSKKNENINLYSFIKQVDSATQDLKMPEEMIHRFVNKGFSGGERKKNEILQLKILEPDFVMLDEIDSGVDVDSLKVLSDNINEYKSNHKTSSYLMITHYTHLLKYIKPDFVHILSSGKIIKTSDASLASEVENNGFNFDKIGIDAASGSGLNE